MSAGSAWIQVELDCQWALLPPAEVNGFVSGKIWAIARLGATSDVREVEKQRLNAVSLEEAQDKYTEVAGELAADTLRVAHQNQSRGQGVTKAQYVEATMAFMEKENAFVKMYDKWLDEAANIHLEDGSEHSTSVSSQTNVYANRSSSQIFDYCD